MGYVLQSAGSAGRVKSLVLQGRFIIAVHRAFVPGCEGPSIAELCSVASRVRWDDGSHTNPGRDMNSPAGMSPSNVPVSKLDHLDLLVCKLTILTCQSANSSILQKCEGGD